MKEQKDLMKHNIKNIQDELDVQRNDTEKKNRKVETEIKETRSNFDVRLNESKKSINFRGVCTKFIPVPSVTVFHYIPGYDDNHYLQ